MTQKYDYIDTLRGFAILGVILLHTSSLWVHPKSKLFAQIAVTGNYGVQLFFIASALTLFLSIQAKKGSEEERPILSFFIRRFFRIAPAFYLAIIIYIAYDLYNKTTVGYFSPNGMQWWFIPLTVIFLHGWHPETINSVVPGDWSIAVEMTFYLFVPYLFTKLNNIKRTLVALLLSLMFSKIMSVVITYFLSPYYPAQQQYLVTNFAVQWFFSQIPIFLLGILLYHLIKKYPNEDKQLGFFLLLASFFLFFAFLTVRTFNNLLPQPFLYGIVFVIFALSLYYWPRVFLINKFTIWVGRLSFSIYLVHFMVLNYINHFIPQSLRFLFKGNLADFGLIIAFILILGVSICFSYITYKVVELPGIKLGKYIIGKL